MTFLMCMEEFIQLSTFLHVLELLFASGVSIQHFFFLKIDVISQKSQKTMWRETLLMLNLPEKLYIEQDYYENMLGFTTVELFLTTNIILLKGSK